MSLPIELLYKILETVSRSDLQPVALALSRVLPNAVPAQYLFECPRLDRAEQVLQFYQKLRSTSSLNQDVLDFTLQTWTVDADIVVNLLNSLNSLLRLQLFIGPNFSPEHLEEIFQRPRDNLTLLSLRFRPYVHKATYFQFLKGAYFDTTLTALAESTLPDLCHLSIIQDPVEPSFKTTQFAQPLVFFSLDSITSLMQSSIGVNLLHLRFRVPARQVTRFLCPKAQSPSLPRTTFLDLSTCSVSLGDISALGEHFSRLEHLILDGSHHLQLQGLREGEWFALGKMCALSGVRRAKERERKAKDWLNEEAARLAAEALLAISEAVEHECAEEQPKTRTSKKGRRGLATAMISLRSSPPREARRKLPSGLPDSSASAITPSSRLRVWPQPPTLRSLSIDVSNPNPEAHKRFRSEFEKGWSEGLAQLVAMRQRLRQSSQNGYRVMRIVNPTDLSMVDQGLVGLRDVDDRDDIAADVRATSGTLGQCPVLCLVGPGREIKHHAPDCGHAVGWRIWDDDL